MAKRVLMQSLNGPAVCGTNCSAFTFSPDGGQLKEFSSSCDCGGLCRPLVEQQAASFCSTWLCGLFEFVVFLFSDQQTPQRQKQASLAQTNMEEGKPAGWFRGFMFVLEESLSSVFHVRSLKIFFLFVKRGKTDGLLI